MTESHDSSWLPILEYKPNFLPIHLDILYLIDRPLFDTLNANKQRLQNVEVQVENTVPTRIRIDGSTVHDLVLSDDVKQGIVNRLRAFAQQRLPFLVLAGSGFGAEIDIIQEIVNPMPSTVVLGMERDPLPLLAALCLSDRRMQLLNGLFVWTIGDDLEKQIVETIKQHALYLLFSNKIELVFGSTAGGDERRKVFVDAFQGAIREVNSYCEEANRVNQTFMEGMNRKPEAPAKVWSSGSATEYTTTPILKAIHRGLQSTGMQTSFSDLPRGRSRKLVEYQGLLNANPDTLFVLNDPSRMYVPEGEFFRAVWVTDDPTFRKNKKIAPRYDEKELVLFADPAYETALIDQGATHRMHLPAFALLENEGTARDELAFPLVFVGMIWNLEKFLNELSAADRDLLEEVHAEALDMKTGTLGLKAMWEYRSVPKSLAEAASKAYQLSRISFDSVSETLAYVVYMMDVYKRRWDIAKALLPLGLHVFGNKEWISLLGEQYADRYHGFVEYENLADVYRSAKVVIGVHSLQLPNALNIRDCDILMAGGCLLCDPVGAMGEDSLLPGRDCETANTPQLFAEKAQTLLANEGERSKLASNGRAAILERFLPQHRAPSIVEALKKL